MELFCENIFEKKAPSQIFDRVRYMSDTLNKKIKFSIKDFSSKCHQIRSFLRIWSHLLKKFLMEKFIFYALIVIKPGENSISNSTLILCDFNCDKCGISIIKLANSSNLIHKQTNIIYNIVLI